MPPEAATTAPGCSASPLQAIASIVTSAAALLPAGSLAQSVRCDDRGDQALPGFWPRSPSASRAPWSPTPRSMHAEPLRVPCRLTVRREWPEVRGSAGGVPRPLSARRPLPWPWWLPLLAVESCVGQSAAAWQRGGDRCDLRVRHVSCLALWSAIAVRELRWFSPSPAGRGGRSGGAIGRGALRRTSAAFASGPAQLVGRASPRCARNAPVTARGDRPRSGLDGGRISGAARPAGVWSRCGAPDADGG